MPRRQSASLFLLFVAISTSSALRSLQQNDVFPAQGPAALATSSIQLNAPGRGSLLNAPALAPSSAPLPAGVVSLAVKQNSNKAAGTDSQSNQQTFDTTTVPASDASGTFSVIKATDNSGKSLPGGYSNKKLSAAQLANAQQIIKQANDMAATTNYTGPIVTGSGDDYTQVLIHPKSKQKSTVEQVNNNAPVYTVPGGPTIKPQLMTGSGMLSQTAQQSQQAQGTGSTPVSPGQQITSAQPYQTDTSTATGGATTTVNVGGRTITINVPQEGNPEQATGSFIAGIAGVRISTPIFGSGFNFCVDRYFGSFPKVGIVIPNAAVWLLPEFQEVANALEQTLDLPSILPHGARLDPTADGFLIQLPTFQPSTIPEFGIRYGIQIGQAFGYDFGLGIVRDLCFVSFVIV
ncbi:g6071 [Coccomyxa viridis]|uniref:G6071 protein n=1 Tax=Coccomyxa viridis TaxID=1274662 RepID=A0ABP1FUG8_9CHLO